MNSINGFSRNSRMNVEFRLAQSDSFVKNRTASEATEVRKFQNSFSDKINEMVERTNQIHQELRGETGAVQVLCVVFRM